MSHFLILDGVIIKKDESNLTHLFEHNPFTLSTKIWYGFGGIPLFNENIQWLWEQIEFLKLPSPPVLQNKRELYRICKRMLNKNKFYRSGYVQLDIFWNDSRVTTLVRSIAFPEFDFPFSMHGLFVNYSEIKKLRANPLNKYHFYNQPTWKIIETQLRRTAFQNSIILNENNVVCECLNSNIYFIKGNTIITPAEESGCYIDKLRNVILEIATSIHLKVLESRSLTKEAILSMNEIFLASEESGIQWILGVENKRYVHHISEKIHAKLNDYLKSKSVQ